MTKRKNSIARAAMTTLENLEQRRMLSASVKTNVIFTDPNHDTPGMTLYVKGTTGKDQISVYDDPQNGQFFVWVDKNHNGTASGSEITTIDQADYPEEINTVLVDSDKGDDFVGYYLVSDLQPSEVMTGTAAPNAAAIDGNGGHRSVELDLAAGNDTAVYSSPTEFTDDELAKDIPVSPNGADVLFGADLNVEIEGQEGNDNVTVDLTNQSIVESEARFNVDVAAGNDTVNFAAPLFGFGEEVGVSPTGQNQEPPPIDGGFGPTVLQVQIDLGSGTNTYNEDLLVNVESDASLLININGGSGKDTVNELVNAAVRVDSNVGENVNLGGGDDTFHSEWDWNIGGTQNDASSSMFWNVQAQDGNDKVKFDDVDGEDHAGPQGDFVGGIAGKLNLQAYGGNGNDSVEIDFNSGNGSPPVSVFGGYFRGLVSGDYGNDKVRIDVAIADGSEGVYDMSCLGGGGDDTLGVRWFNPNDEFGCAPGEYGPGGGILVDGGRNNDKYDVEFDEIGLSPFIVRACEKFVDSLEVGFF